MHRGYALALRVRFPLSAQCMHLHVDADHSHHRAAHHAATHHHAYFKPTREPLTLTLAIALTIALALTLSFPLSHSLTFAAAERLCCANLGCVPVTNANLLVYSA